MDIKLVHNKLRALRAMIVLAIILITISCSFEAVSAKEVNDVNLDDGKYKMTATLRGGSGRASIESPAEVEIKDGKATVKVVWSSPNYQYMIVNGKKYNKENSDGNSEMKIPAVIDSAFPVQAMTTAMSKPYTINYIITLDSKNAEKISESNPIMLIMIIMLIIFLLAISGYFMYKRKQKNISEENTK